MQGRTSFIIAHRLSTIQSADFILVMVKGDIVEHGTHDDLMAKQGVFITKCKQPKQGRKDVKVSHHHLRKYNYVN